jgi:hypothetical protein
MANPTQTQLDANPAVEWFAGQIPSPVLRLRFLREFMPSPCEQDPRKRLRKSWLLIAPPVLLLLFTAPPSARAIRAAIPVPLPPITAPARLIAVRVEPPAEIWQVEKTDVSETYSNGLRIDNRFSAATHPRSYRAFPAGRQGDGGGERRSVPAGIVFHTTESMQAPFEPDENSKLKRIGESLLDYVRRNRSYNFLIDRFGRVYRIVPEADAANHAGHSIWSDSDWVYLNLNESFLGVSFETQTLPGQMEADVNPAQVQSAAMLTDMLRRRYGIPAGNCVTHAQVSVNAAGLRIGYHLDWASSFPFARLGLPDNYAVPLPAVSLFGFEYDSNFARRAGVRMLREAQLAEQVVRDGATAAHMQFPAYRRKLQLRYRSQVAALQGGARL